MKTLVIKSIILLFILATCAAEPVFSQNQEQLFQKALMKEEGEGALQEAIDIYTRIVENSSAERSLRANAQLQIGLCYEKLGKKQATEAYNKVIEQYADQHKTAEIAKIRLQKLNSQIATIDKNVANHTIKQIIVDRELLYHSRGSNSFDFSPDGESFVYISDIEDYAKSVLYIANISGPPSTRLVSTTDFIAEGFPRYLPDGKQIAFIGWLKNKVSWAEREFYLVNSLGGKPKNIAHRPLIYSPDGKYIVEWGYEKLVIVRNHLGDTITSFSLASNTQDPWITGISPDSKWISYKASKKGESRNETDCWIVSFSGDKSIRLTNSKGYDGYGTWSEKNYSFYFVSDRDGDQNIFRLKINPETGEKKGNAEQITFYKDADVSMPRFIKDKNALAYCLSKTNSEIVIPEDESLTSFKTIATGKNPVLSPDGNTVYFVGTGKDNQGIYSIPRTGGVKKILTDINPDMFEPELTHYLSPDGLTIAFFTEIGKNKRQLCFLSTNNNILEKSVTIETSDFILPDWSPDSKKVAFVANDVLFTIPAWGNKAEILTDKEIGDWETFCLKWSPDGKYIAGFVFMDGKGVENSVVIISVKTGEIKRLTTKEEDQYKQSIEWHPGSKKLAYMYYDPENDYDGLREAYVDGSPTTEMIDQPDVWDYVGTWDPTGENYYFVGDVQNDNKIGPDLFIYNTITKEINSLIHMQNYALPSFSKDGKYMVLSNSKTENQLWMMEGVE